MAGNLKIYVSLISQIGSKLFFCFKNKLNKYDKVKVIGKPATVNNLLTKLINRFLQTFK